VALDLLGVALAGAEAAGGVACQELGLADSAHLSSPSGGARRRRAAS
jgi:hypothetical protein